MEWSNDPNRNLRPLDRATARLPPVLDWAEPETARQLGYTSKTVTVSVRQLDIVVLHVSLRPSRIDLTNDGEADAGVRPAMMPALAQRSIFQPGNVYRAVATWPNK
jgi:hypothetical protein